METQDHRSTESALAGYFNTATMSISNALRGTSLKALKQELVSPTRPGVKSNQYANVSYRFLFYSEYAILHLFAQRPSL